MSCTPFGREFGPARVDDLRQVKALGTVARRLAARFDERMEARHTLGRRTLYLRRQPQKFAEPRRERRGFPRCLRHGAVARKHARGGMVEDEGDVLRLQHEVDRNHDRAEPHQGVAQRDKTVRIAREDRDFVAPPDPTRGEAAGEPFADGVQLPVGPARPPQARPIRSGTRAALRRKVSASVCRRNWRPWFLPEIAPHSASAVTRRLRWRAHSVNGRSHEKSGPLQLPNRPIGFAQTPAEPDVG